MFVAAGLPLAAQDTRLPLPFHTGRTITIPGHVHRYAQPQFDQGPVDGSFQMNDLTLLMQPSPQQQAALEQLLAAQQDPASPQYHQWLSPQEFADRFAPSQDSLAQVTAWLESQGFTVTHVGETRNWIAFKGTAGQAEQALGSPIHRYNVNGESHFANTADPRIPEALSGLVSGFRGLHDFLPRPPRPRVAPQYTVGSGYHYLAPADLAAIYNLSTLFNQGIDGTGQTIAVVGQTNINTADIQNFRSIFRLPVKTTQVVMVPGKERVGIVSNELLEADLDLEWAGAAAKNATLVYVAAPNVFDAVQYTVSQRLAPVLSMSYGLCETGASAIARQLQAIAQQANAEGITWLASSGDSGAADCDAGATATQGLSVDLPASVPEITGVGGTSFSDTTGSYWTSSNGVSYGSALSYIPETAWNDTTKAGQLEATGGGISTVFAKPSWQTGQGVPGTNARYVPDVAMPASAQHDGALVCTAGGCANGLSGSTVVVGGTSLAAPILAGIVALTNQAQSASGLGNINPRLYVMAQTTTGVFHDITTGNNIVPCQKTTKNCTTGTFGYQAGVGYDPVTGLGSVDAYGLATQWSSSQPRALTVSSVAIAPSPVTPGGTATVTITMSGSAPSGGATVMLASSNVSAFPVPASVSVTAGQSSTSVQVTAGNSTGTATITATYNSSNATASATVATSTLPAIRSAVLSSSTVSGPGSITLTITLSGPAPAGGSAMTLTSSNSAVLPVPSPVTMSAGASSGALSLTVNPVISSTSVTLTLSYNNSTATAPLTVTPMPVPTVQSVIVSPSHMASGGTAAVTVILTGPAPFGGSTVTLASSNAAAFPAPTNLVVPAGLSSAVVQVTAGMVAQATSATLTAAYNNSSSSAPISVAAAVLPVIKSITLTPGTIVGPATVTLTVTLSGPAPPGGASMALTSSNSVALKVPAQVTMPVGVAVGSLALTASKVATPTSVTLTLSYNNSTQTAKVMITPK